MQEHLYTNLPYTQREFKKSPMWCYFYLILDLRKLRHVDWSHSQQWTLTTWFRGPRVTKSSYCSSYCSFHFCLENLWEGFHHWPLVRWRWRSTSNINWTLPPWKGSRPSLDRGPLWKLTFDLTSQPKTKQGWLHKPVLAGSWHPKVLLEPQSKHQHWLKERIDEYPAALIPQGPVIVRPVWLSIPDIDWCGYTTHVPSRADQQLEH